MAIGFAASSGERSADMGSNALCFVIAGIDIGVAAAPGVATPFASATDEAVSVPMSPGLASSVGTWLIGAEDAVRTRSPCLVHARRPSRTARMSASAVRSMWKRA
jgi:hypothetical protein